MILAPKPRDSAVGRAGVLPDAELQELIKTGAIATTEPIEPGQVQPNSIDLRLGRVAYRTRCSFLPVGELVGTIMSRLRSNRATDIRTLDEQGFVLECGQIHIIPLEERLALPPDLSGLTNPKSSTGRLDILARVLTDRGHSFDVVPPGYSGPLYLEVITRSFPIRIRPGDSLAQLRVFRGSTAPMGDDELKELVDRQCVVRDSAGLPLSSKVLEFADGVVLSVDLIGRGSNTGKADPTVGFRAKSFTPEVDLRERGLLIRHYWQRIHRPRRPSDPVILDRHGFYIFASRERVVVPPEVCAEMVAVDVRSGEVRMHYAGFFDSGFGLRDANSISDGARVVLEVRNMDVPFLIQDKQQLCRLRFFRNTDVPLQLYGRSHASNYQGQGLKLAKQFGKRRPFDEAQLEMSWTARSRGLSSPARRVGSRRERG
jgi:dCTP deaminase